MKTRSKQKNNTLRFTRISPASNVIFNLLLIILAAFCLIPLLLVLAISLSSENSIRNFGYRLIPDEFSLKGYGYLLQQRSVIFRSLVMSVQVTCLGTALGLLLTSSMGYVLSRAEYKMHKFFTWFIFIPMIFNGGLVSTYFVVSQFLGFRNTMWALIMPLCVTSFNVIVCRTFFRTTIPDSVVESATIDGAGQLTIYFRIVLPLSLPVLATIGLFLSFAYWNDWFQSMLYIDNTRLLTLQAYLNRLLQDINFLASDAAIMLGGSRMELIASMPKEAARMAIVVIAVAPIACVYPFFQRYFISGLTIGAVKG